MNDKDMHNNTYWDEIKDKKNLLQTLKGIRDEYKDHWKNAVTQARIYQNFYDSKIAPFYSESDSIGSNDGLNKKRFAYNIIGVAVEYLLSKVSRLKPKPSFISNSFLYSFKSKIKRLDVKTLSIIKNQDFYEKSVIALKNSYIQDIGILKSVPATTTVNFFPIQVNRFFCYKPYEGSRTRNCAGDETKMSLYQIYKKIYPKMDKEMQDMFVDKYELQGIDGKIQAGTFIDKQVSVFDFYIVKKSGKGRRVAFTDECILVDEEWPYDFIPYDFTSYIPAQVGIIGTGVSQIGTPMQQRLNTLLKKISKSIDASLYPIILAHISSRVEKKFTDELRQVVTWEGAFKPEQLVQAITHPQVFEHLNHIIHFFYRSLMLDETAVATSVPENVDRASGVAIKNLETADQAKTYQPGTSYESFVMSVSKKIAKYIIEQDYDNIAGDLKDDKDFFKNINTWPVSMFPSTPEGKFQRAEFLVQSGMMTPEEIADFYDFPEMAGHKLSNEGSRIAATYFIIENNIEKGKQPVPDPLLGYDVQLKIGGGIYGKMLIEQSKYEKEIILVRNFLNACIDELEQQRQKQMEEQMRMQAEMSKAQNPPPPTAEASA